MTIEELVTQLTRYPKDTEVYMMEEQYSIDGNFEYKVPEGALVIK